MRAQNARASPESPRIQTIIRADSRKADVDGLVFFETGSIGLRGSFSTIKFLILKNHIHLIELLI